jgi:NAD(P)-dependent dehydrogenase (short-subunit alcohol dehydrogenase family)
MTSFELEGHVVAVVGAGSGIGRGTSQRLAELGATVVCLDRRVDAVTDTAASITRAGGRAVSGEIEVGDADSVRAVFDAVAGQWGRLHAVVNCAGVQGALGRRAHEVPIDDLDAVWRVNVRGALLVTTAAVAHMLPAGYGRIAHVASIAGKEGNPNMISYSTTKAAMIGMVKALGKEYATDGITVNALAPAVIRTEFLDTQPDDVIAYMTARIPMGRPGTVEEAASMLAFMVSPLAGFTTGFTFDLSGGRATY